MSSKEGLPGRSLAALGGGLQSTLSRGWAFGGEAFRKKLIKRLDNDDLEFAAPPVEDKIGTAGNPEIIHTPDQDDAPGKHVHSDLNLTLAEGEHQGEDKNSADGAVVNKHGKKVNDEGGFNPYG